MDHKDVIFKYIYGYKDLCKSYILITYLVTCLNMLIIVLECTNVILWRLGVCYSILPAYFGITICYPKMRLIKNLTFSSYSSHDDIKWKQFLYYWPFVRGIHCSPVESPHKGQWCGALMFSLICAWTKVEQTINMQVIWDAIMLIMTSL